MKNLFKENFSKTALPYLILACVLAGGAMCVSIAPVFAGEPPAGLPAANTANSSNNTKTANAATETNTAKTLAAGNRTANTPTANASASVTVTVAQSAAATQTVDNSASVAAPEFLPNDSATASSVNNPAASTSTAAFPNETAISPHDLKTGAVVKVNGADIYIDRGALDGVDNGAEMDVFHSEPVTGLDGTVLDMVEMKLGALKIKEVKNKLSVGEMKSGKAPERGDFVKYKPKPRPEQETGRKKPGLCPPGMLYDEGGLYTYTPHVIGVDGESKEKRSELDPFCIDRFKTEASLTWLESTEACHARGARLCSIEEDQKVCSVWDKPKPCDQESMAQNKCPVEDLVYDFKKDYEWVSYPVEKNGERIIDAGSCSCHGRNPACNHCFKPNCQGAKKQFRCCREPLEKK